MPEEIEVSTYKDMLKKYGQAKYKGEILYFKFERCSDDFLNHYAFKGKVFLTDNGRVYARDKISEKEWKRLKQGRKNVWLNMEKQRLLSKQMAVKKLKKISTL